MTTPLPRPTPARAIFRSAAVVFCLIGLCYLTWALNERSAVREGMARLDERARVLDTTEAALAETARIHSGPLNQETKISADPWRQIDLTFTDIRFNDLIYRLSALSAPDRIFVLESFTAGFDKQEQKNLVIRVKGRSLCLSP